MLASCTVKPEPLDDATINKLADTSLANVTAGQEPVRRSIDIYEAIARALKYNLDQKIELMQQAVKTQELNLSTYQGLPNMVAGTAFAGRNNDLATNSRSVRTGRQSLETSTSSQRQSLETDLALSWNVLDFGVSYIRAHQAADQVLIQEETRRRALNRIVEDVRTAYWRAIASQNMLANINSLEAKIRKALADSRSLSADRVTSPIAALTYERELLEIRREAERIEGELGVARNQLAALMNLPMDTKYTLSGAPTKLGTAHLNVDTRKMVRVALVNRPEMREVAYRMRINEKEMDVALLELLPGINVLLGGNNSTNSYLFHSNWLGWGAKASWNLMRVFQYPAKRELVDSQGRLLDERSLALTMAISTQVYVSRARYLHAEKELATAGQLRDVQRKILVNIKESTATDRTSEQTLIREQMNMIVSDVRYDLAYGNLQNSYANVYSALGLDAFPPVNIDQVSVSELAQMLRKSWVGRGDLSVINKMNVPAPSPAPSAPGSTPAPPPPPGDTPGAVPNATLGMPPQETALLEVR